MQARQYEFDHDGRSADQYGLIWSSKPSSFKIGRNEAHMAVPALLLPVDGQIYIDARRLHPDLLNLLKLHQIVRGTGTVEDIYRTVIVAVIQHIIDDGTKRCKTDSSGDEQKILSSSALSPPESALP